MDEEIASQDDVTGPQADAEPDRQVEPVDAEQPPRLPFPVVGIGASAGGLEAVGEFLDAMPGETRLHFPRFPDTATTPKRLSENPGFRNALCAKGFVS
jgi:chemotaxis response regulator CheB